KPEWITISSARSMSDVIEELLNILRNDYPDLETASIHKHMMDIENEYSSLIGFNIALPHGYSEKLDESIVMVAKTTRRVISKINNDEVHLVFMVLSPREKPNEHINTLSEISKFIMNEENREKLFTASSHADMVEVFFPQMRKEK
ncbi:MAG TPA: PTS sugar transporter subunit IIA, partial [Spirochaetota bacterium]|nr:PTS sugar transporter subunit IIA [Spirochaetota bacterium]